MVKRNEITLLYEYNDNWIGGSYYIINIIKALNFLDDGDKPILSLHYSFGSPLDDLVNIKYPYIKYISFDNRLSIFDRIINKVSNRILGENLIKTKLNGKNIKNLYPMTNTIEDSNIVSFFYWIPDFQEKYLPHLFSLNEIKSRNNYQTSIVKNNYPIIFSSYNALNDFKSFYPENRNRKEVLRFVSIVDEDYLNLDIDHLKRKFSISGEYFISPNQFWQHKNQKVLIKAAKILKEKTNDFQIVFTGKEFDHRNGNYANDLKKFVEANDLENNVKFLGFIDRNEQLQLMKNSIAVVQPSLFEGWSTVVEDVKAINHVIILSDLPLHREQISQNCIFFNPEDENDLTDKLFYTRSHDIKNGYFDNKKNQKEVAKKIISLFN